MGMYPSYDAEELRAEYDRYLDECKLHTEEVATPKGVVVVSRPKVPAFKRFYMWAKAEHVAFNKEHPAHEEMMRIKNDIESRMEEALQNGQGNSTGLIFTLKCNYGWQDKQVVEGTQKITVEFKDGQTIL